MRSISIEALVAWLESGDPPRLIDVLSAERYAEIHLPRAENIPRQELAVRAANELARDEPVVVYCAGPTSRESERAVAVLEELGYDDVVRFEGGLVEWRQRGLPVVDPAPPGSAATVHQDERLREPAFAGDHERVRDALRICLEPEHLRRTLTIAIVVGTILTAINHADVILRGEATWSTVVKAALNYVVPFIVSNLGLLAGARTERRG
jgi:rhodanese-related sulfurtransferase